MKAQRTSSFEPDYAVPPGETLREVMESLGMNQTELAVRTGLTVQTLIRVFNGDQPITYETANRLELVTGVPARMWNNLEALYREQLTRLAEREHLKADLEWLKTIPTRELIERGLVQAETDKIALLRGVLAFYGVSSVAAWRGIWENPAVAARRSPCFETRPGPASAWIRQGELQAQSIACAPYDRELFQQAMPRIRSLTKEAPEVFVPELRRLCAEAGVAVALVREMKKVPWNGATKWLSPHKAMILLSLRGKGEDRFWFSFFHEAGHVLNDNKRLLLVNDGDDSDGREAKANRFAADTLIPPQFNDRVRACKTAADIVRLAGVLGVAPGIVAGRHQYLTGKWDHFRDGIRKFQWGTV